MTVLCIVLGVLFLIFLPIINIYSPILNNQLHIPDCLNKDYDFNPKKKRPCESNKKYKKRLQNLKSSSKIPFTFKKFCRAFIIAIRNNDPS